MCYEQIWIESSRKFSPINLDKWWLPFSNKGARQYWIATKIIQLAGNRENIFMSKFKIVLQVFLTLAEEAVAIIELLYDSSSNAADWSKTCLRHFLRFVHSCPVSSARHRGLPGQEPGRPYCQHGTESHAHCKPEIRRIKTDTTRRTFGSCFCSQQSCWECSSSQYSIDSYNRTNQSRDFLHVFKSFEHAINSNHMRQSDSCENFCLDHGRNIWSFMDRQRYFREYVWYVELHF